MRILRLSMQSGNLPRVEQAMLSRMDDFPAIFPLDTPERCLLEDPQMDLVTTGQVTVETSWLYPQTHHLVNVTVYKDTRSSFFVQDTSVVLVAKRMM